MSDVRLTHYNAEQAQGKFDELVAVYVEVYADTDDPFFSEDRYRRQLAAHIACPGFELVAAWDGHDIAGYVYGYTLQGNARWWGGLITKIEPALPDWEGAPLYDSLILPLH